LEDIKKCECGEEKEFGATIKIHCQSCSIVVKKISFAKPFKVAGIAVVLAYGGSNFVDYAISDNRYPLDVEHAVIEACISSSQEPLSYRHFSKKRVLCLCAMEKTMNEISYTRYVVNESGFLQAFEEHAQSCN